MYQKTVKKLVGSKSERDIKEVSPVVDKILNEYDKLQSLSNDELRAKTADFKQRIAEYIKDEEKQIEELQDQADSSGKLNLHEKEVLYKQIDDLHKKTLDKIEEILEDILPEAFAVVKETARRFKENEKIEVTATELDKDLAAGRDSIEINGDKAEYSNFMDGRRW